MKNISQDSPEEMEIILYISLSHTRIEFKNTSWYTDIQACMHVYI